MKPDLSGVSRTAGSQTLARGLRVLKAVVSDFDGMSIQDVAEFLGVHRTIAYRILNALSDAGLISRSKDGRYRGSTGLLALAASAHMALRAAALPVLNDVANALSCTVSLLVREGAEAVALAVVEPREISYRISFAQGSRTPLDRGAAAHAIRSLDTPTLADSAEVVEARRTGYSVTFGEVEPNMYGFAVPISGLPGDVGAVVNLITNRVEIVESARDIVQHAAAEISRRMNELASAAHGRTSKGSTS